MNQKERGVALLEELDFLLSICREMIPGKGEDSYCHSFREDAGLLAVFDGCGGAGARAHDFYSGRTEAYMASRLCAGAFYDTFRSCQAGVIPTAQQLADAALQRLRAYTPPQEAGSFAIQGSMVRTLPTTAAAAVISRDEQGLLVTVAWAGDSRVYLLDDQGLAQLTEDDTSVPDPMENVYEDGILRNVFCADRDVKLRSATVRPQLPFALFCATDGCFGYVSTPMEFEGMLLQALLSAESPAQWEQDLVQRIGAVAGDDHCLCLASFGYGSFEALQQRMRPRFAWLQQYFLEPVSKLPLEDRISRFGLWQQYREPYFRFWKGGQA